MGRGAAIAGHIDFKLCWGWRDYGCGYPVNADTASGGVVAAPVSCPTLNPRGNRLTRHRSQSPRTPNQESMRSATACQPGSSIML